METDAEQRAVAEFVARRINAPFPVRVMRRAGVCLSSVPAAAGLDVRVCFHMSLLFPGLLLIEARCLSRSSRTAYRGRKPPAFTWVFVLISRPSFVSSLTFVPDRTRSPHRRRSHALYHATGWPALTRGPALTFVCAFMCHFLLLICCLSFLDY